MKLHRVFVILWVLAFIMVGLTPSALADDRTVESVFEFDASTGTLTKYKGSESIVTIPEAINNVAVTKVSAKAFHMTEITALTIPQSILEIEDYAFADCTLLQAIHVDEANLNYASRDGVLFDKAKERLIVYPSSKSGTSYTILDGVKAIADGAFGYNMELESITMPDTLEVLGAPFSSVPYLAEIKVKDSSPHHVCVDNVLYDKAMETVIQYPRGKEEKTYVIPEGVTTIAHEAFLCCHMDELQIPDSVTTIGEGAFSYNGFSSIHISQGVTVLEKGVLQCTRISTIDLSNNITEIKEAAFFCCELLDEVIIPDSVEAMDSFIFSNCSNLTTIKIPDHISRLEQGTFAYCSSLEGIEMPDELTAIGDECFLACRALGEISIPPEVTSIGKKAFAHCDKLKKITIPESVTSIDDTAFYKTYTTIYGKSGSYAENFAVSRKIKFVDESAPETTPTCTPVPTEGAVESSASSGAGTTKLLWYAGIAVVALLIIGLVLMRGRGKAR